MPDVWRENEGHPRDERNLVLIPVDPRRQRLRATTFDLSDMELMDIGITRREIDYVASNRSIDPVRRPIPTDVCLIFSTKG
jgi:hypothetical protein